MVRVAGHLIAVDEDLPFFRQLACDMCPDVAYSPCAPAVPDDGKGRFIALMVWLVFIQG